MLTPSSKVLIPVIAVLTWCVASLASAQPFAYVLGKVPGSSTFQQQLTVVNAATNTKGQRIQLGRSYGYLLPQAIAMAPDGDRIYVINDYDHTVSIVSTATNAVVDTLPQSVVGTNPFGLAVSPDSERLYIVGNNQLFIAVDLASRARVATVTHNLGGALGVVASPDGARVYMTAIGSNRLATFSTAPYRLISSPELPGVLVEAGALTLSPDGRFLYIPQRSEIVNPCGANPNCIPLSPPDHTSPQVLVLDTTTGQFVAATTVGGWTNASPRHVVVSPNGSTIYVSNYSSGSGANGGGATTGGFVHRLSPSTQASLGTLDVVPRTYVAAFLADSSRAYFAGNDNVFVVDAATHAVTATIPFAAATDGRALGIVTTPPPQPARPDPPANLRATVTGSRVSLVWDAPPNATVTGHTLEGGATPASVLASIPTGSAASSFTFDAPSGVFWVRMRAVNGSVRSLPSNEVQIFVNVPQPPEPPLHLLGLADGSNLALSWTPPATGGTPASFLLDVSGAISVSLPLPVSESFAFSGVPVGTYTFAVRSVNGSGTSAPSAPLTLMFPGTCPGAPQAPANFAAARQGSRITVTWDPPTSGPAVTGYVLNVAGAMNLSLPLSSRTISGAVPPGTYQLSVRGVNPCGTGSVTPVQTVAVP